MRYSVKEVLFFKENNKHFNGFSLICLPGSSLFTFFAKKIPQKIRTKFSPS